MSNYIVDLNNRKKLDLYALQLANMIRIRENDAVYIFDEVGTGKTISAGLSIIELLFNNNFKNVLIITDNSVLNQFKDKLEEKLNLKVTIGNEQSDDDYKIKIINQVYSNIEKEINQKYDFIVIDEAHSFLDKTRKKFKALRKLSAKKVMFLTATPIKNGKEDLDIYADLGAYILVNKQKNEIDNKNDNEYLREIKKKKLKEKILWSVCDPELLCKTFDPYLPVTRYFKDISRNIVINYDENKGDYITEYAKKSPVRLTPKLWDSKGKNKYEFIFEKIVDIVKEGNNMNRFIIFTWFKEDIKIIASYFEKSDYFEEYKKNKISNKSTYLELMGGLANKPKELIDNICTVDKKANLPTIIITNAQTSEVGVDFPGYNHVINYHINSTASSTEQRFGRIDRMNSIHDELNMCFVIDTDIYDTSTRNYFNSMTDYIDDLLKFLPSKNILVTDETPKKLLSDVDKIKNRYEEDKKICNEKNIRMIIKYLGLSEEEQTIDEFLKLCKYNNIENSDIVYDFMQKFRKYLSGNIEETDTKSINMKIDKEIETEIKKINQKIKKIRKLDEMLKEKSNSISNKILYSIDEKDGKKENEFYKISTMDSEEIYKEIKESNRYKFFESKIIGLLKKNETKKG